MQLTPVEDQAITARMALIVGGATFDRLFDGVRFDEAWGYSVRLRQGRGDRGRNGGRFCSAHLDYCNENTEARGRHRAGFAETSSAINRGMCSLYSITTNQAAIIALFRVMRRYLSNLPPMPGVFPDYPAPVVRISGTERELTMMRGECRRHPERADIPSPISATHRHRTGAGG
jgi:hypothetical protein